MKKQPVETDSGKVTQKAENSRGIGESAIVISSIMTDGADTDNHASLLLQKTGLFCGIGGNTAQRRG
jgi:hypothetical protein